MEYKKSYTPQKGLTRISTIGESSLKMLEFAIIELGKDQEIVFDTGESETAFVILGGTCDIRFGDTEWTHVGQRRTVFEGKAAAAYIPRHTSVHVSTPWSVKIAVIQSPIGEDTAPWLVKPEDVKTVVLGKPTWKRDTHFIIDDRVPSKRLYVGEAFVHPGNWAGFPPHKHDMDDMPSEAVLEEFYYYLFHPQQGFAIQRLYTGDGGLDETYVVKNDDLVEFPKGYHPIVNAPGYNCYFLWAMAGDYRGFFRCNDPEHDWVAAIENFMNKNDL